MNLISFKNLNKNSLFNLYRVSVLVIGFVEHLCCNGMDTGYVFIIFKKNFFKFSCCASWK